MNLTGKPEDQITYQGHQYRLNLAYPIVLTVCDTLADEGLAPEERVTLCLRLLLTGNQSAEVGPADEVPLLDLIYHEKIELAENVLAAKLFKARKPVFDFELDAGRIAASFRQQYQIDLTNAQERNHISWAFFNALLNGLDDNTPFRKATAFRTMEIPKDATADQRKYISQMKQLYALDQPKRGGRSTLQQQMAGMDRVQRVKFLATQMKKEGGDNNG